MSPTVPEITWGQLPSVGATCPYPPNRNLKKKIFRGSDPQARGGRLAAWPSVRPYCRRPSLRPPARSPPRPSVRTPARRSTDPVRPSYGRSPGGRSDGRSAPGRAALRVPDPLKFFFWDCTWEGWGMLARHWGSVPGHLRADRPSTGRGPTCPRRPSKSRNFGTGRVAA